MNRSLVRGLLAGPFAMLAAILAMAATPLLAPSTGGSVNHIVLPIVLFPAYWAVTCLYAVVDERLKRVALILSGITLVSAALIIRVMAFS